MNNNTQHRLPAELDFRGSGTVAQLDLVGTSLLACQRCRTKLPTVSIKTPQPQPAKYLFYIAPQPFIIDSLVIAFSKLSLSDSPTSTVRSFDIDMAFSTDCAQTQISEFWITYNQASRMHEQVAAQLINVGDAVHIFDLEDVLDHVFDQGFMDPKLRSVVWWEDCTSVRLKASSTVQDLLVRGAGSTPETALRLIIGL